MKSPSISLWIYAMNTLFNGNISIFHVVLHFCRHFEWAWCRLRVYLHTLVNRQFDVFFEGKLYALYLWVLNICWFSYDGCFPMSMNFIGGWIVFVVCKRQRRNASNVLGFFVRSFQLYVVRSAEQQQQQQRRRRRRRQQKQVRSVCFEGCEWDVSWMYMNRKMCEMMC